MQPFSPRGPRPSASRLVVLSMFAALSLLWAAAPAAAQLSPDVIADEVDATGSYVEPALDDDARAAIAEANERGVGVVLLNGDVPARDLASDVLSRLEAQDSRYRTVLVVTREGAAAGTEVYGRELMGDLIDPGTPAFTAFAQGRTAEGIRTFIQGLDEGAAPSVEEPTGDQDAGRSFPWVALLVVVGLVGLAFAGFWLVRQRREQRRAQTQLEARRSEIGQQLRNNADRVITLGDTVIASGNTELVDLYGRASATFRDVSHSLEGAGSTEALDRLDERLDQAERDFEVIEARLAGRIPPRRRGPGDEASGPAAGRLSG